jgi:hypothetical protein
LRQAFFRDLIDFKGESGTGGRYLSKIHVGKFTVLGPFIYYLLQIATVLFSRPNKRDFKQLYEIGAQQPQS